MPAGDPYKAPASGRASTLATPAASGAAGAAATPAVSEAADTPDAPTTTDPLAAPAAIDEDPLAAPTAPVEDTPEARAQDEAEVEGTDAWSSARDWADNSAVPSTTETSEGSDVTPHNLGGDLPVDEDRKA